VQEVNLVQEPTLFWSARHWKITTYCIYMMGWHICIYSFVIYARISI
jgi:hypothetical protein